MNMKPTILLAILLLVPGVAWPHDGAYLCDHEVLPDQIEDPKNCHLYNPEKDKNPDFKKWHFNFLINSEDTSWHLLTVSHLGTVSLIKGLSKKQCNDVSGYLLGTILIEPGTWDNLRDGKSSSNIDRAECFQ